LSLVMKATGWPIATGASVGTLVELMLSKPWKASTGLGGGGPAQPAASSISAPSAIILEIILAPPVRRLESGYLVPVMSL
jgi:hypothetical protein